MYDSIWEIAAMTYLTWDRGLFVNPQYQIGEQGAWEGSADFLALDFGTNKAWMVEVTRRPNTKFLNKISEFEAEYAPRIEQQLSHHKVYCTQGRWNVGLWVFCPEGRPTDLVVKRAHAVGLQERVRFTTTEETVAPGSGWETRFR